MIKKQELFNKMWTGLEAQGWEQALNEDQQCRYLTYSGARCAVGHCLSNPDPEFEGGVTRLILAFPEVKEELGIEVPGVFGFLVDAQETHDVSTSGDRLKLDFEALARRHDLVVPE